MDYFNPQSLAYGPTSAPVTERVLCCRCGTSMAPNVANTCVACLKAAVDVCAPIPKTMVLQWCRQCNRYLQPPQHWLKCELESKELLAFMLRRLKPSLSKLHLVDAMFLWTEPHSRRIKLKVAVQAEVQGLIMQQECVVEATVTGQQCPDCAKVNAKNMWMAAVQVRQKVPHKRTFLYLEQVILKRHAHADVTNIKGRPDGLDFYFAHRNHALKFVHFLETVVPMQTKISEQLISQDIQSGTAVYKFTYSVEMAPICKDDLLVLPRELSKSLGGAGPFLLCTKVGTSLHLTNPFFASPTVELSASAYFRAPFTPLFSAQSRQLVEYYVLDIDTPNKHPNNGAADDKFAWVDAVVARVSDFGAQTSTGVHARTHLGHVLKCGDIALGYDLQNANTNNDALSALAMKGGEHNLPDVVLVRKSYAHLRSESGRKWHLRRLDMQVDEHDEAATADEAEKPRRHHHKPMDIDGADADQDDEEQFMQDIEEDAELRAQMALYKSPTQGADMTSSSGSKTEIDIPLEQLLDDLQLQE